MWGSYKSRHLDVSAFGGDTGDAGEAQKQGHQALSPEQNKGKLSNQKATLGSTSYYGIEIL